MLCFFSCKKNEQILSERDTLLSLFHATNGYEWNNHSGWNTNKPLAEWYGVSVNKEGKVTHINLSGNKLRGYLHSNIGSLQSLKQLDISNNKIAGEIPSQIGYLKELAILKLNGNNFRGMLPKSIVTLKKKEHGQLISLNVDPKNRFIDKSKNLKKERKKGEKYYYPIE